MEVDKPIETKKGTPSPPNVETKMDTTNQNQSNTTGITPNYPLINSQHQMQTPSQGPPSNQQLHSNQQLTQGKKKISNI